MSTVIVEASEAWPVVAAGLGSAVVVAFVTLKAARKQRENDTTLAQQQRGADAERTEKQLDHDRKMREKQQEIDAARFEQQLAHDREMRQRQNDAESKGLDRQLAHDREMRDLQLMRETLAPLVSITLDWDAFISLHKGLATTGDQPYDAWEPVLLPLVKQVGDAAEELRRGGRTLVVIAGPSAPVASRIQEVARDADVLVHLVTQRVEAGSITPEIQQALDALLSKFGHDHARFIEAANEAMQWGEAEPAVG